MGDEVEEGEPPINADREQYTEDTRSNFDDDLRELKYQYRSVPIRVFFLHVWPRLNYFWLHIIYITSLSVLGGAFIWWIEQDNKYYSNNQRETPTFIDATLSTVSATTTVGMVTLDFWGLKTSSQVIHLILAQLGCSAFVAAMTAFIRRKSLSVWLAKHPQRKCNEADNVVVCHGALLRLGWTLLLYNLVTVLVVWILLTIYTNTAIKSLLKDNTIDPTWFAFFTAICSFNQTGFALLRDGLIPINNNTFFALLLSVVILFSNMLLPLVMRALITLAARLSKEPGPWKFMLEHPRICSTVLFPALQTKILSGCVLAFFVLQVTSFALLDFNYPVLKHMSGWHQFVLSIFQSANNMHAGFPVLQVDETNTAQQWCYFIFMLVAVYPYVSMLRNTEVVREGRDFFHPDSLLKQSSRNEEFERQMHQGSRVGQANIVWTHSMQHLKQTFLGDAFWLIFAVFLICVWEGASIETDPEYPFAMTYTIFSMWKVIFEVASAYGGVGLSLGYPEIAAGFSQIFSQKAKVVMMGVLILGRHREMPRQRDVAVMQVEILAKSK